MVELLDALVAGQERGRQRTDLGQDRVLVDLGAAPVAHDGAPVDEHPLDRGAVLAVHEMVAQVVARGEVHRAQV